MIRNYIAPVVNELTAEVVDKLIIHQTLSSLRRAGATSPCIKRVDGTDKIPVLYYIKGVIDESVEDWSIHALTVDINRYLLLTSLSNEVPVDPVIPTPEDPTTEPLSVIEWDGAIGKPMAGELLNTVSGRSIVYSGNIAYYNDETAAEEGVDISIEGEGNYVCSVITPDEVYVEQYPNAVFIKPDGSEVALQDVMEADGVQVCTKVEPGFTAKVAIVWDEESSLSEEFIISVSADAVMES